MTRRLHCLALLLAALSSANSAPFPEAADLPSRAKLPDPLIMQNGTPVTSKRQWVEQRRPELKALFQHYMYGKIPSAPQGMKFDVHGVNKNYFGGKATKKDITIDLGNTNLPQIHLLLVVPNQRTRPAPVFVGPNFCGNYALVTNTDVALPTAWVRSKCPGCVDGKATE